MIKTVNTNDIREFVEDIMLESLPGYETKVIADSFCVKCYFEADDINNDTDFKNQLENAIEDLLSTGYFLEPIHCENLDRTMHKVIYVYTKDIQV